MINNIVNVDARMQQINVAKASTSQVSVPLPPMKGFKLPKVKEKANLRIKKFSRMDNILIVGEIDDDYVDIVEEELESFEKDKYNFFKSPPLKRKMKYLKDSYVIDYIQSPQMRCGLGTEAIKNFVERNMFDSRTQGRIVTYCMPICKESSPAQFFYKLGFRFIDPNANQYIQDCINKKIPDIPPQTGMMYLPRTNLHKLLRYGELF